MAFIWCAPRGDFILTGFQKDYLIVLRELKKARYHFSKFNDLLNDRSQFLSALEPELFVRHVFVINELGEIMRPAKRLLDLVGLQQAGPQVSVLYRLG